MSELILYDFPPSKYNDIKELIKYLPLATKNTYYQYRICCYQTDLYLPNELWNEIVYLLCEPIADQVVNYKLLDWFDLYIHDKRQHDLNPILMHASHIGNAVEMGYLCAGIDISYGLKGVGMTHNTVRIPRLADLVVGIVKDDRIKSIEFTMGGIPIKYQVNELYEYTFGKVYSHTLDEITQTNISTTNAFIPDLNQLLDPKYLNKQNTVFWSVDIMPFSLLNAQWHDIFVELEVSEPMTEIKLLYGALGTEIRNDIVKGLICYKNLKYDSGMILVNG